MCSLRDMVSKACASFGATFTAIIKVAEMKTGVHARILESKVIAPWKRSAAIRNSNMADGKPNLLELDV